MLKLDSFATPVAEDAVAILAPINGDDNEPAVLVISPALTIAVCKRGETGDIVLARFREARDATENREARDAGWVASARVADFARAVAGGLLA